MGETMNLRRVAVQAVLAVLAAASGVIVGSGSAAASDCFAYVVCGEIYNHGNSLTLVAASLDRTGGDCPPFGRCGTCDVPAGRSSHRPECARVFADTDVFTYDRTAFRYKGVRYPAQRF